MHSISLRKFPRLEVVCDEFSWNSSGDCGWIHPLKLLVRKGLTVSDVGEVRGIIIPKVRYADPFCREFSSLLLYEVPKSMQHGRENEKGGGDKMFCLDVSQYKGDNIVQEGMAPAT